MRGLLLLAALLLLAPHAGAARVLTAPYAGQPVGLDCDFELPAGECPDAPGAHVQFGPFAPASAIDVTLTDAADVRVGAALVYHDAAGEELGRGWVCAHARKLHVPAGTAYVRVLVDTPLSERQHCPNVAPLATVGTVALRLR